jgi:septum formation protein
LLRQIGVEFELLMLRGDPGTRHRRLELELPDEDPAAYVARGQRKAAFALQILQLRRMPARPVLAADTTVTIDGRILGKPASREEAEAMLERLSGRTHQVLTSVAVHHTNMAEQVTQVSDVRFATLSAASIRAYCATSEPYDKAGGYGIQGLAALFVEHIDGSHSGIMGLPLHETARLLRQAGVPLP